MFGNSENSHSSSPTFTSRGTADRSTTGLRKRSTTDLHSTASSTKRSMADREVSGDFDKWGFPENRLINLRASIARWDGNNVNCRSLDDCCRSTENMISLAQSAIQDGIRFSSRSTGDQSNITHITNQLASAIVDMQKLIKRVGGGDRDIANVDKLKQASTSARILVGNLFSLLEDNVQPTPDSVARTLEESNNSFLNPLMRLLLAPDSDE